MSPLSVGLETGKERHNVGNSVINVIDKIRKKSRNICHVKKKGDNTIA